MRRVKNTRIRMLILPNRSLHQILIHHLDSNELLAKVGNDLDIHLQTRCQRNFVIV